MGSFTARSRRLASTGSRGAVARFGAPTSADVTAELSALDAIDSLEGEVRAELAALAGSVEGARPFAAALRDTLSRQRVERGRLRQRLGLVPSRPPAPRPGRDPDLGGLRDALDALVYAHADAVPAFAPFGVAALVGHLRTLSGQLTVVDLWLEREQGDE